MSVKDQWKKDGKRQIGADVTKELVKFAVLAGVSPALAALVPVIVVIQAVKFATKKKLLIRTRPDPEQDRVAVKQKIPLKDRKYDVVVLGATGFTGKLAVKYLGEQYGESGKKIKWAIAGRRKEALEKVKAELNLGDVPVIVCDTTRPETLHALVEDTRAVATMAGPFSAFGTEVVKFCASYGTHYADSTGEVDWVREMIDRFDPVCRETGARIVSFCGHDCVPWDLMVMKLSEKLKAAHDTDLAKVDVYDRIVAQPSGGTLDTIMKILFAEEKYKASLDHDPLVTTKDGKGAHGSVNKNIKRVQYCGAEGSWGVPFLMADCNAACVKRSNALNKYGTKVEYKEGLLMPNLVSSVNQFARSIIFAMVLFCPPLLALAKKYALPKPGEGPSVKQMDHGWLLVRGYGQGEKPSTKVTASMYFKTDPGYRDTGRMVAEAALTLALTEAKLLPGDVGGIFTPASGIGQPYLDRLCATGTEFAYED